MSDSTIAALCLVWMGAAFWLFIGSVTVKEFLLMPWSTWCERLTDAQIERASEPEGYDEDYRQWPKGAWQDWRYHAWHCQSLIATMRAKGWVGEPLILYPDGDLDGNHRLRAVQYLMARGEWPGGTVPCIFRALPGQESPEPTAILASRLR